MDFYLRRRLSVISICGYLFLGGMEFGVIFPTAWQYLQSLGVEEEYMLGIALSAYSFSGAFAGILGGHLADAYPKQTGKLCFVCIILMFIGNLQYTIGMNVWNIVGSRLICGVGTAAGAALLAFVCRVTTAKERTSLISTCNASRQMGVLIGPAFQALLSKIDVNIGPVSINSKNAAGLVMASLWLLVYLPMHLIIGRYDYTALPLENYDPIISQPEDSKVTSESRKFSFSGLLNHSFIAKEQASHTEASTFKENLKYYGGSPFSKETEMEGISFTEQLKQLSSTNQLIPKKELQIEGSSDEPLSRAPSCLAIHESSPKPRDSRTSIASMANVMASISIDPGCSNNDLGSQSFYKCGLLSDVFVSLLGTAFTLFYCQILIETIIPVYMKEEWGFDEIAISLAYVVGGLESLIIFAALIPLSHHVSDAILQFVGKLILIAGFIILLVVVPNIQTGRMSDFYTFIGGCFTVGIAYPIASVSNASLLSKSLSAEKQGIGQGWRRFITYLGLILGPLWGGSTAKKPMLLMGVTLAVVLFHSLLYFHVMNKIRRIEKNIIEEEEIEERRNVRTSRL